MTSTFLAESSIRPGVHPEWHVLGMTFNADTIISTLLAAVIVIAIGLFVRAKATAGVPGGIQLFFETVTKFFRDQVESAVGLRVAPHLLPFTLGLFFFLLICNWFSVLPMHTAGGEVLPPPTADVNLVYPLAILVFVAKHVAGARRRKGAGRQLVHVLKGHLPALAPMWVLEEGISVVSHSLRLFGNIFAGGIMIAVIGSLLPASVGWALNGGWKLFDMFIGLVQAFIFALVTVIYFGQSMEVRDEHH
ncbi:MAG: F0F1 ATP synthase subunit A [Kutzneria sp.]|nr:F0F1 ATP synthase subunit A [Kutzneria sp.]MBV9847512.1 F0F1 ATP synthase subunit A [Kutzneria sp.]